MYPYFEDPRREHKLRYYAALGKELKKKERAKEAEAKQAAAASHRTMLAIEWFILGIVLQPFVGTAYNAALLHLQHLVP